ncbi:hypothetical protein [Rubinisphaera italica]|uniref:Uncharacterized protein n=1 Tax=Rubinisphaera italica TaxID=2527969 RepID=A0A5C5XBP1_9PLAN|nr:hypothetical protein [Rubinisphaera italica]TWT59703.1 hypothetical protein Pan54_04130 [Rubinisphaera italica]
MTVQGNVQFSTKLPMKQILHSNGEYTEESEKLSYIFPIELLNMICQEIGEENFDTNVLVRERKLSQNTQYIGFWRGMPLSYPLLKPYQDIVLDQFAADVLKQSEADCQSLEDVANDRLRKFNLTMRAYCGWLLMNEEFLKDHDRWLNQNGENILKFGIPCFVQNTAQDRTLEESEEWVREYQSFCQKWRLQSLAAPRLPVPQPIQSPYVSELSALNPAEGTTLMAVPDIYPTFSRGILPDILEDSLRGSQVPGHLQDWMDIAAKENTSKNTLGTFQRRFALQHYWRVFYDKFPTSVSKNVTKLHAAFSTFFQCDIDTIRGDLRSIKNSLGPDWQYTPFFAPSKKV